MANHAKVAITGRLVREPRKSSYNDSTVVSFTVAVFTTKKVDDKYVSDFYNVSFWGKAAEAVFPRLDKGVTVQVYGDLYQEEYTDKNQNKRLSMSVRAQEVIAFQKDEEIALQKDSKVAKKPATEEDPF